MVASVQGRCRLKSRLKRRVQKSLAVTVPLFNKPNPRDPHRLAREIREINKTVHMKPYYPGGIERQRIPANEFDAARSLGLDAEQTRIASRLIRNLAQDVRQSLAITRDARQNGFTQNQVVGMLQRAKLLRSRLEREGLIVKAKEVEIEVEEVDPDVAARFLSIRDKARKKGIRIDGTIRPGHSHQTLDFLEKRISRFNRAAKKWKIDIEPEAIDEKKTTKKSMLFVVDPLDLVKGAAKPIGTVSQHGKRWKVKVAAVPRAKNNWKVVASRADADALSALVRKPKRRLTPPPPPDLVKPILDLVRKPTGGRRHTIDQLHRFKTPQLIQAAKILSRQGGKVEWTGNAIADRRLAEGVLGKVAQKAHERQQAEYQRRYVLYARAQGRTPEGQARWDAQHGGSLINYGPWVTEQIDQWRDESGHTGVMSRGDHAAFDDWLGDRYPEPEPEEAVESRIREPGSPISPDYEGRIRVMISPVTGSEISLVDNRKGAVDPEAETWLTVCETHGQRAGSASKTKAAGLMKEPHTWCSECQGIEASGIFIDMSDERLTPDQVKKLITTTRKKAESLKKQGGERLDPSIGRLNPTARRSRIATGMRLGGVAMIDQADRYEAFARRMEQGYIPTYFERTMVMRPSAGRTVKLIREKLQAGDTDRHAMKGYAHARLVSTGNIDWAYPAEDARYTVTPKRQKAAQQYYDEWNKLAAEYNEIVVNASRPGTDFDYAENVRLVRISGIGDGQLKRMREIAKRLKRIEIEAGEHRVKFAVGWAANAEELPKEITAYQEVGLLKEGDAQKVSERYEQWVKVSEPGDDATQLDLTPAHLQPVDRSRNNTSASRMEHARELELKRFKDPEHRRIAGYFPTPYTEAAEAVDRLDVSPGMSVLEPSAGTGMLADMLPEGVEIDTAEISPTLREVLDSKGYTPFPRYEEIPPGRQYDRIIMNPPFEKNEDIYQVFRNFSLNLKPGGRLVAIVGSGALTNSRKINDEFRAFVSEHRVEPDRRIDPKLWRRSGTNVNAIMITLEKPE